MDPAGDSFYSPFGKPGTSRDATNLLRPYHRTELEALQATAYSATVSPTSMPARSHGGSGGRDFRDMFSDIDYGDYLPNASPSTSGMAKRIMDEALWNYTSIVLSQPFEVAKVILQCYDAGAGTRESGGFNGRTALRREIQVRCSIHRRWCLTV
jgi:fusion and transport protein UGO1